MYLLRDLNGQPFGSRRDNFMQPRRMFLFLPAIS
jgi:hypothetical protein